MVGVPRSILTPQQRYYELVKEDPEYKTKNRECGRRYRERKKAAKAVAKSVKKSKARKKTRAPSPTESLSSFWNQPGSDEETPQLLLTPPPSTHNSHSPPIAPIDDETPSQPPTPPPTALLLENPHRPPSAPFANEAYQEMYQIRLFLRRWTSDWGPVRCWPKFIIAEYRERVLAREAALWRSNMQGKAEEGRVVLNCMKGLFVHLPHDPWIVRDLWCQAFELLEELQAGLACLQAHLDYEPDP